MASMIRPLSTVRGDGQRIFARGSIILKYLCKRVSRETQNYAPCSMFGQDNGLPSTAARSAVSSGPHPAQQSASLPLTTTAGTE